MDSRHEQKYCYLDRSPFRGPGMHLRYLYLTAVATFLTWPADVMAETIVDSGSKISLPANIDDMQIQPPAFQGIWGNLASGYRYRNTSDLIELNVFRASYPSSSLWFAQAENRTEQLFAAVGLTRVGAPEQITVNAEKPNGLRALYTPGTPFTSTATAVISFGSWLVSIHSTSKTLDINQQRERLSRIIAQIIPSQPTAKTYPLEAYKDCPSTKQMVLGPEGALPLETISMEMKIPGGLAAMVASKDAGGESESGIAAQPSAYCRRQSPSGKTIWYETVDAAGLQRWVIPVSETGVTVEAMLVPATDKDGRGISMGVVLTNDLTQSSVRSFYNSLPNPISAQLPALAALMSSTKDYASVKYGTDEIKISN